MNDESSVSGVSLESMVAMTLDWKAAADADSERAVFVLPRNAGRLSLIVHQTGDGCELVIDYEDPVAPRALRNIARETYRNMRAAKKWAVLRIMALVWIIERSHGSTADFHFEAPPGL